jgi:hypothetical protein
MGEAQHNAANAFVKSEQNKERGIDGRAPEMEDRYMKFDACMVNNGMHAQELAVRITKGMDKEAFPVRNDPDELQD